MKDINLVAQNAQSTVVAQYTPSKKKWIAQLSAYK